MLHFKLRGIFYYLKETLILRMHIEKWGHGVVEESQWKKKILVLTGYVYFFEDAEDNSLALKLKWIDIKTFVWEGIVSSR